MQPVTGETFDHTVDVLVIGSGGGGMTAALAADAFGLDTLVVEKSAQFGGSTALSGGWRNRKRPSARSGLPSPWRRRTCERRKWKSSRR
jgi:succinate dehydrogenase/fumarate reductase flavoprotein subunit